MCSPHLAIRFLVDPRETDLFLFLPPGRANTKWADPRQEIAGPLVVRIRTRSLYELKFRPAARLSNPGWGLNTPISYTDPDKNPCPAAWPTCLP